MNYPYASSMSRSNANGQIGNNGQLGIIDWVKLLFREIWLMIAVFSLISLMGIAFAMTLQKKYTAEARLSVLVGEEYVYKPQVGAAGEGASPKQEQIVQSEVEIMTSAQVLARVVKAVGLNRLFDPKDLIVTQGLDTPEHKFNMGVEAMRKLLGASATPNTTVIKITFANKDPQIAAETLNKLIDEYLHYRREVLFEDRSEGLGGQALEFSNELNDVQNQINQFLIANNISDYESERASIQSLLGNTRQELLMTISRRTEAEGRFSATDNSFTKEPGQVRLSFETDISKRKIELQQQLSELLTKYTEESQPVQDMRRRIAALDEVLDGPMGKSAGVIKTGPNPVRDILATERAKTNAEVKALRDREQTLMLQVESLQARAMQIATIRPEFEELMRKKAVLEEQVKQFSSRELSANAQARLNASSNDNIRVIERALVPTKGKSMKKFVALGAIMFAGFCALIVGLIRALSRKSFNGASSASRNLGIPVLATLNR